MSRDHVAWIAAQVQWITSVSIILAALGLPTWAARINGTVVDPQGTLDGTVVIVYTRVITPRGAVGPQAGAVGVDATGAFTVNGLSAGTYALCVQGAGHNYLDPCVWSPPPPKVELKNSNASESVVVNVVRGVRLQLTFRDPKGLVDRPDRPAAKGRIRAGIWQKNGFYLPIPETARTGANVVRDVVVPADESLHLSLDLDGLRLLDGDGNGLPRKRIAVAVVTKRTEPVKALDFSTEEENQ